MAKAQFEGYKGKTEFLDHETKKYDGFVETQGGPVDPYGDEEKKEKSAIDMNAGEAFNHKDLTKIEAMGTDYPKKGNFGQMNDNKGEHFKVEEVVPMGNEAGKTESYQSRH